MDWRSSLEVYDLATGQCRVIFQTPRLIEAPNWHRDGWFLVNGDGRLWRIDPERPDLRVIDTGGLIRCNNDHGFLDDGRIVFSCHNDQGSGIYVLNPDGPAEMLSERPSWWHGAGRGAITYACVRGRERVVRIALLDLASGRETLLSPGPGHHDGPDLSPCGAYVWFNSDRGGHAQIWRVPSAGGDAEQVFKDRHVNWFPHPSPDGRHVLYLAYPPGTEGHPRDLDVGLWLMAPDGSDRRQVVALFGGQGTINVPCWAHDGHAFAFMRYRPLAQDKAPAM